MRKESDRMRLSWNETRAAAFAQEWADEGYEKAQTQLFHRGFSMFSAAPFAGL